ncbi:rhodanese-like domain-containing protein [Primorskyibacter sp. S87]|uniref:rhodanese-like domain-containing protein n=1 Tax=Primorskyibacter sp. S87 TaxID=3415126 RepID=UPI003C7B7F95
MRQYSILTRRVFLALACVLVVAAGAVYFSGRYAYFETLSPDYSGKQLTVEDAMQGALSGEVILVDIRTPREWRTTGVPAGAHPLDMRRPDFAQALVALAGNDLNRTIALICARGVRSARLGTALSAAGFSDIRDVPEGMLGSHSGPGWLAGGLPVVAFKEDAG